MQTLYRETIFNCEEGRFLKKEDGEILANKVKESEFQIVSNTKSKGKEYAPKLFDLTGLQVYCNNKFAFSAEETLNIVQKLYEQKVVTYPRVDTTFLPNDIYPKVPGILNGMKYYSRFTEPLLSKPIPKSKTVFDDKIGKIKSLLLFDNFHCIWEGNKINRIRIFSENLYIIT